MTKNESRESARTETAPRARVSITKVYKNDTTIRTKGSKAWMDLDDRLMSPQEKELVKEDEDLRDDTIRELLRLKGPGSNKEQPEFFGSEGEDGKPESDIGIALLSSCIRDNKRATWAELCGRYAAIRGASFLETAIALKKLYRAQNGYFILYNDATREPNTWQPKPVGISRFDMRKTVNLNDEWAFLAG